MRSADHVHIIPCRTMLAGLAAAPLTAVTSLPLANGSTMLAELWQQRTEAVQTWEIFQEEDDAQHQAQREETQDAFDVWAALERQMALLPSSGSCDVQLKIQLLRDYLPSCVPFQDDDQDTEHLLLSGLLADIERLFLSQTGAAA